MKFARLIVFILLLPIYSHAQNGVYFIPSDKQTDSMRNILANTANDTLKMCAYYYLSSYYTELNKDSSLYFGELQLRSAKNLKQPLWAADALFQIAYLTYGLGNYPVSLNSVTEGLSITEDETSEKNNWRVSLFSEDGNAYRAGMFISSALHQIFAFLYDNVGNTSKAISEYNTAIKTAQSVDNKEELSLDYMSLGGEYRGGKPDSALAIENKALNYAIQSNYKIYLGTRKRASAILQEQKDQIEKQKEKVESTLSELRSTQAQLIQSEKMASLGELTAGIAHEIQNPLNFVNNFSEVSTELVDEMNIELDKGNNEEAKQLAQDLKENLEKINHHGKRAGDIVKGMLQHSRSSTGVKEPADVNALADEYLRLSYHGMRAKDKEFNVEIKTDFDESIGKINIIPQDIGRVLLNLYNNAFYAVTEKAKQQPNGYEPMISVATKKINNKVEITVKDNGNGIPQNVVDKIFQPFFTTKPAGEGTGLGLSLSYDIVKAHVGELKVETKEGEGTEFIILLPT